MWNAFIYFKFTDNIDNCDLRCETLYNINHNNQHIQMNPQDFRKFFEEKQ